MNGADNAVKIAATKVIRACGRSLYCWNARAPRTLIFQNPAGLSFSRCQVTWLCRLIGSRGMGDSKETVIPKFAMDGPLPTFAIVADK